MNILITGAAGFIGYHTVREILRNGHYVVGLDNLNDYYSVKLKKDRLNDLKKKTDSKNFKFYKADLENITFLKKIFKKHNIKIVINLAAQAGVRYSLKNPNPYIKSNIQGFVNLLEICKKNKIDHFIFASSSSIYGKTKKIKFSENDKAVSPVSLYASTKRCNEIIAHSYSHLYNLQITGLRFFTVYGAWGRPDMAYFKFVNHIINGKEIEIYNYGNHTRDFSYIDHIVNGILSVVKNKKNKSIKRKKYEIYNLANGKPIKLMSFISVIEKILNKKAKKKYIELQDGDVEKTYANVKKFETHYKLKKSDNLKYGILKFIKWYKKYYKKNNYV